MDLVDDLCAFIDGSPCAALAADTMAARLRSAGFAEWDERSDFPPTRSAKLFVRRGAALVAVVLRGPTRRFHLVGAHTDSPHLKLKPNAAHNCEGCKRFGVEVYGGALWNSWLDRDLGLAGTVWSRDGHAARIHLQRPLARVAQLAIHLDRKVNDEGLKLNPQQHLAPLWGLGGDAGAEFLALLSEASGIAAPDIVSHDLSLVELTPARRGGGSNELLFAGRLDNLASCHAGLQALLASADTDGEGTASVLACFDHEEVGSTSESGADGVLLAHLLERLSLAQGRTRSQHLAALADSVMFSADMAHAVHPNYADRHEPQHRPRLGGGPVLKANTNQRYATSGATAALVHTCARRADTPMQDFVTRTDLGCGSTIGPTSAARLGIAVADLGSPMLSMHSCRECAAVADHEPYVRLLAEHLSGR